MRAALWISCVLIACGPSDSTIGLFGNGPPEPDPEKVCAPGQQVACPCRAGDGVQACLPDGSGYSLCDCSVVTVSSAGGGDGSGGSGWTPSSTSSSSSGGGAGGDGGAGGMSSGAGGAGGCDIGPNPCSENRTRCGVWDRGCGFSSNCGACNTVSPYLYCAEDQMCSCTLATPSSEAVGICQQMNRDYHYLPMGLVPYFCGPPPVTRSNRGDCWMGNTRTASGEYVSCCAP